MTLTLEGTGPIEDWQGAWSLTSNTEQLAGGRLSVDRQADGFRIAGSANGDLVRFVPEPYSALLAGQTNLNLQAFVAGNNNYRLDSFELNAPRLTASASGSLDLDTSKLAGEADLHLRNDGQGGPISLQLSDGSTIKLGEANAQFSASPAKNGTAFASKIDASNLDVQGNKAKHLSLDLSALQPANAASLIENLDEIALTATADIEALADPDLKAITGEKVSLQLNGSKAGMDLNIANANLSAGAGNLALNGVVDAVGFDGEGKLSLPDAAPLSKFAGRELSGSLAMAAKGRAGFDGSLDLQVDGQSQRMAVGSDFLGQLLAGGATLGGQLTRDTGGALRLGSVNLKTEALGIEADGRVGMGASDLKLTGTIGNLASILPNSSGPVQFEATLEGEGETQKVVAEFSVGDAVVRGKSLSGVVLRYDGDASFDEQSGTFEARGKIGEASLTGTGELAIGGKQRLAVRAFEFSLGANRINADVLMPLTGDTRGTAQVQITDASELAPLLGLTMNGSASLEAAFSGSADAPALALTARSDSFQIDTLTIDSLGANFDIRNLLARPVISGNAAIKSLSIDENKLDGVALAAVPDAERSALELSARFDRNWQFSGKVLLGLPDWQPEAELRDIAIRSGSGGLVQEGAAKVSAVDGQYRVDGLVFKAGDGRVTANLAMAEAASGKIEIKRFPASMAKLFVPEIEPRGAIDGTVDLSGSAGSPKIDYKLTWRDASIPGKLPPGFPALSLSASGAFVGDELSIDAAVTGPNTLNLKANGALRKLTSAPVLDVKANGTVPLALAEPFLALRGTRFSGAAALNASVTGSVSSPVINGSISGSGATISDPSTGVDLKDTSFAARMAGKNLRIEKFSARSENGGTLTGSGTIGILENASIPADLQIKASVFRFNDQRVVAGELSGDVALKGALAGQSKLTGNLDIARLDIQIPRSLPSSIEALDLKHVNAPDHIAVLQPTDEPESENDLPSTIGLSLEIKSANRIFVTGRGLDAQLGGALQLNGSADKPRAIGEFTLERGRLAVLGRTLEFASGSVTFTGELDPVLNFLATTEVDGTRIDVTVTGQASNPKFAFSSSPELPEDEVLALLLFNKSLGELSPLQIAQLASEISELTGLSGGPGILGQLKAGFGIDTLNVTTDQDGEASVSAGSYLNDKVFVGVEQGTSSSSSRVKVDLDITKNLKLRGETGAGGKSKVGIGVEWEY
jgi:translocation and assembly module TamB